MFGFGSKKIEIIAPFSGTVTELSAVDDQVFASEMVGVGCAITPTVTTGIVEVCAPVSGTVATVLKTKHAVGLKTSDGVELLIHFGLDTVGLKGEGFEVLVAKGDSVTAGQPLLKADMDIIASHGLKATTQVIFTAKDSVKDLSVSTGAFTLGDIIMTAKKA